MAKSDTHASGRLVGVASSILVASVLVLALIRWPPTMSHRRESQHEFSYIGRDYPRTWGLTLGKVHKATEDTAHYALDSEVGRLEWDSLLPRGGGMLHLGPHGRPFGISMFHQLRCLDAIGHELTDRANKEQWTPAPTALSRHCMNYLRQMILCRSDLTLESAKQAEGPHVVIQAITHTCNDWSVVYAAAEENYVLAYTQGS